MRDSTTAEPMYNYFTSIFAASNGTFTARIYIAHEDNASLLKAKSWNTREEAVAYAIAYKERREELDREYMESLQN